MSQVSVAIYVPNYVPHLFDLTMKSVVEQTVPSMEILVLDDCRTHAESKSLKSLFKKFCKNLSLGYGKSLRLLTMGTSIGYADSFRAALNDSSGKYFTVLFSGDVFCSPHCLSHLLKSASSHKLLNDTDWDLVQGCLVAKEKDPSVLRINPNAYDLIEKNKCGMVMEDDSARFAERYIIEENYSLRIEGKLFLRETLSKALDRMPRLDVFCAIEYLWMYFFCREATSLLSVKEKILVVDLEQDVASGDFEILTPDRFAKICSASTAFSAIFFDLADRPMEDGKLFEYLRSMMSRYAISNARHISRVHPSIKSVCTAIFEDSWGADVAKTLLTPADFSHES